MQVFQSPPYHVIQVFQSPPYHVIQVFQSPPYHVIQVFQSPPNHVIQVFQSPPCTQVYTIKPLGMQTASTNTESIAKDLQTWCGLQMSPTTVRRELHGMGFHG
ncbi:unnamed protein product, partial [Staurois parvus]